MLSVLDDQLIILSPRISLLFFTGALANNANTAIDVDPRSVTAHNIILGIRIYPRLHIPPHLLKA